MCTALQRLNITSDSTKSYIPRGSVIFARARDCPLLSPALMLLMCVMPIKNPRTLNIRDDLLGELASGSRTRAFSLLYIINIIKKIYFDVYKSRYISENAGDWVQRMEGERKKNNREREKNEVRPSVWLIVGLNVADWNRQSLRFFFIFFLLLYTLSPKDLARIETLYIPSITHTHTHIIVLRPIFIFRASGRAHYYTPSLTRREKNYLSPAGFGANLKMCPPHCFLGKTHTTSPPTVNYTHTLHASVYIRILRQHTTYFAPHTLVNI